MVFPELVRSPAPKVVPVTAAEQDHELELSRELARDLGTPGCAFVREWYRNPSVGPSDEQEVVRALPVMLGAAADACNGWKESSDRWREELLAEKLSHAALKREMVLDCLWEMRNWCCRGRWQHCMKSSKALHRSLQTIVCVHVHVVTTPPTRSIAR